MRRVSETIVCDSCGCSHIHAGDGWKVKVIEGKEYDLCSKCAEWFDKLENGRRVRGPYMPYVPWYPYRPYEPWPRYEPRDWVWYEIGDTTSTDCTVTWRNDSGESGVFKAPRNRGVCIYATS